MQSFVFLNKKPKWYFGDHLHTETLQCPSILFTSLHTYPSLCTIYKLIRKDSESLRSLIAGEWQSRTWTSDLCISKLLTILFTECLQFGSPLRQRALRRCKWGTPRRQHCLWDMSDSPPSCKVLSREEAVTDSLLPYSWALGCLLWYEYD